MIRCVHQNFIDTRCFFEHRDLSAPFESSTKTACPANSISSFHCEGSHSWRLSRAKGSQRQKNQEKEKREVKAYHGDVLSVVRCNLTPFKSF